LKRKQFESEADFQAFKEDARKTRAEAEKELASGFFLIDKDTIVSKDGELHEIVKFDKFLDKMGSVYARYLESLRYEIINNKEEFDYLATAPDYVTELEPYFITLLNESNMNLSLAEFYHQCYTDDWQPIKGNPFSSLIEQARKSLAEVEKATSALSQVTVNQVDKLGFGLDKLSLITYDTSHNLVGGKQYRIDTLGDDAKNPVLYLMDFDGIDDLEFKTTKEIDGYDELVQAAAAALSEHNGIFSETQICKLMGIPPTRTNRENVRKSMEKQLVTKITINNLAERKKAPNYPEWNNVTDSLISYRRVEAEFNGKKGVGIALKSLPILQEFARGRKQFTVIDRKLLDAPDINKTRRNIKSIVFLIKRISHIKSGSGNPIILKRTLYEEFNIKNNHKAEYIGAVNKILSHFKNEHFITDFTEDAERFTIYVSKELKQGEKKKALKGEKS
jgi:hypothetical protein